jgi:hypothetical protein
MYVLWKYLRRRRQKGINSNNNDVTQGQSNMWVPWAGH